MTEQETQEEQKALVPTEAVVEKEEPKEEQPVGDVFVIARSQEEMIKANQTLILWAEGKLKQKREELTELSANLELAKKNKWRTTPFKNNVNGALKRVQFYEKLKAALEEGYCIVPDMDIDVFAIRTTKKTPKGNYSSTEYGTPWVKNQESENPPINEGRFVSVRGEEAHDTHTFKDKDGKDRTRKEAYAIDFQEVDFPFKLAKPGVLTAAGEALKSRIFDEVGILPRRRVRGDPMIIGRINYQHGSGRRKSINFVIAWFIDTKDL